MTKQILLMGLLLTVSCGKNVQKNPKVVLSSENNALEKITCNSDGSYTECTVLNKAVQILSVRANRAEDCLKNTDYYLLSEKVLVTRNGCKGEFLLEVEGE
jgi:hypothetical protein